MYMSGKSPPIHTTRGQMAERPYVNCLSFQKLNLNDVNSGLRFMLLGPAEKRPKARQSKTEQAGAVFRGAVGGG